MHCGNDIYLGRREKLSKSTSLLYCVKWKALKINLMIFLWWKPVPKNTTVIFTITYRITWQLFVFLIVNQEQNRTSIVSLAFWKYRSERKHTLSNKKGTWIGEQSENSQKLDKTLIRIEILRSFPAPLSGEHYDHRNSILNKKHLTRNRHLQILLAKG